MRKARPVLLALLIGALAFWISWDLVNHRDSGAFRTILQLLGSFGVSIVTYQLARVRQKKDERERMKPCPTCGYSLKGNTTGLCPECGNKIIWCCPRCGKEITQDAQKCDVCGCNWAHQQ